MKKDANTSFNVFSTGYVPRPRQLELHKKLARFSVLVHHRRWGKTVFCVNEIIDRGFMNPLKFPQYAYTAPTIKQSRTISLPHFLKYTTPLTKKYAEIKQATMEIFLYRKFRLNPLTKESEPDYVKIMLVGSEDPDSIRGIYLDGVVLDEYAQCDPIIWGEIIRPALADRGKEAIELGLTHIAGYKKPWAIFIGTPKGQNHFYRVYIAAKANEAYARNYEAKHDIKEEAKDWAEFEKQHKLDRLDLSMVERDKILEEFQPAVKSAYLAWCKYKACGEWMTTLQKASETGILSPQEMDSLIEDMSAEEVQQELECSFYTALKGSFFGENLKNAKMTGRIGKFPHDPKHVVDTFWDIGVSDDVYIWFRQKINNCFYYIKTFKFNRRGVPFYVRVLEALAKPVGTITMVEEGLEVIGEGFRYGRHVWPHDGKVVDFSTGVSRQEAAKDLGLNVEIQNKQSVADGIEASRSMIDRAYFDQEGCDQGLECLYNYASEWDSKLQVFKKEPKHDWASHGSDAFKYSALDTRDSPATTAFKRAMQRAESELKAITEYDEFSLGG